MSRGFRFNTGDDGIAMVSYDPEGQTNAITIEANSVEHIRWVGESQSSLDQCNDPAQSRQSVAMAAGILVAREASFHTPGSRNITMIATSFSTSRRSSPR